MENKPISVRMITLCAMAAALIAVVTAFLPISGNALIPGSYAHLGDSMIYIASLLLPPAIAALAAGIGSMMADLFVGAAVYMLPTLVIKGLAGLLVSALIHKFGKTPMKMLLALVLASLWIVAGYFAYEAIVYGLAPAAGSLAMNFMQVGFGVVIAYPIMLYLRGRVKNLY